MSENPNGAQQIPGGKTPTEFCREYGIGSSTWKRMRKRPGGTPRLTWLTEKKPIIRPAQREWLDARTDPPLEAAE